MILDMASTISECMRLYEEAVSKLSIAAVECQKTFNVDITLILSSCEKSAQIIKKLSRLEHDPRRVEALDELLGMINYHGTTLTSKIKQLDCNDNGKLAGPVGPDGDQIEHNNKREETEKSTSSSLDSELTKNGEQRSRHMAIQDTKVTQGSLTFNDVAGLEQAKQALKEAIIMPIEYPHLFTGGRKPWRRILLYGPPGTGKSRLAQAVAAEIKSSFFCVSSSDLLSSWVGESEKLIKELFQNATRKEGTSVVFIDEIDSICRRRSSGEEEHSRRIKTELLHQMEGAMTTVSTNQVFLLAATNCPWELDPGFLRRFQKRIYIPLPDKTARRGLMEIHMRDSEVILSEEEWEQLVESTSGYSGSDLANMVLGALFEPIRELQKASHWRYSPDQKLAPCEPSDSGAFKSNMADLPAEQVVPRELRLGDFLLSLKQHQKTVTSEDLYKFDEFTKLFGQNG